jgi:hypothetical protein
LTSFLFVILSKAKDLLFAFDFVFALVFLFFILSAAKDLLFAFDSLLLLAFDFQFTNLQITQLLHFPCQPPTPANIPPTLT